MITNVRSSTSFSTHTDLPIFCCWTIPICRCASWVKVTEHDWKMKGGRCRCSWWQRWRNGCGSGEISMCSMPVVASPACPTSVSQGVGRLCSRAQDNGKYRRGRSPPTAGKWTVRSLTNLISRTTGQRAGQIGVQTRWGAWNFCGRCLVNELHDGTWTDVARVTALRAIRPTADCYHCTAGVSVSVKTRKLIYCIRRYCNATSEYSPISNIGLTPVIT